MILPLSSAYSVRRMPSTKYFSRFKNVGLNSNMGGGVPLTPLMQFSEDASVTTIEHILIK